MQKAVALTDARIKIDHIHWYVPHYTPSIHKQDILSKQILSKTPTELRYVEMSVFMKQVNNRNLGYFELGSQETMNVPIWPIIGFQEIHREASQNLNNGSFCRLPVTSAHCINGTEKYPDAGIVLIHNDDDYSQAHAEIKEVFGAFTKNDILPPYISDDNFRSFDASVVELGFILYIFDIRYQQIFIASQPIKKEFIIDGVVFNDVNGYFLEIAKKLVPLSSNRQKPFDLI